MASIRLTPVSAGLDARGTRSALVAFGLALSLSLGCAKSTTYSGTGGHSGGGVGGATGGGGSTGAGGGGTGVGGSTTGTGGNTTGTGGSTTGTGGSSTGTGGSSSVDAGGSDASCQTADFMFAPKIPTVYVLVDRSGSEFTGPNSGTYFTLQAAVMQVISQLQGQVRFGFGALVGNHGTNGASACMAQLDSVPIDINNATKIGAMYTPATATPYPGAPLGPLQPYGVKADTPAAAVMPMVKSALLADTGTGKKYMMFVTDGETDYCDDSGELCPIDSVTYRIQDMYTNGIGTLVIGLPSNSDPLATSALQNFANAGAGQTVALPAEQGLTGPITIWYDCNGKGTGPDDDFNSILTESGHTGMDAAATYGSPAGTAQVFAPTTLSTAALATQITAAIAGVKSCSFDLSDVNGRSISVDTTQLGSAQVLIGTKVIPQDGTNGWSMSTATELVLNGTSCATWDSPNNNDIQFNFPCSSIIIEP